MNSTITFLEDVQNKWLDENPFIGGYRTPHYMIKDGKRYFMFNSASDDNRFDKENQESRKAQLIANDGKYFKFNGVFPSPLEMLKWIIDKKYQFCSLTEKAIHYEDGTSEDYFDFHGNLKEISAAFFYRIYDEQLIAEIKTLIKQIPYKKRGN